MVSKKIHYLAMCFVLGYLDSRKKMFKFDSEIAKAYRLVILDVEGRYEYQ